MPRVTQQGTFVFVKGNMIVDGWGIEVDEGEAPLTNATFVLAIIEFLRIGVVNDPAVAASLAIERAMKGSTGA